MPEDTIADPRDTLVEAPEGAVDYSHELISSKRVEGTAVYSPSGEKLGTIHSVMIGKRSGQVAYAVLSAGGWLGLGRRTHVHPLPWELLTYDVDRDGYVVELSRERLERAPSMTLDETDRPIDRDYQERVSSYWGTMPWWGV
jgi:hypothetical protein